MGAAWAWIMSYGHLSCGLCLDGWNVDWAVAVSHYGHRLGMGDVIDGHDYLSCRLGIGDVIDGHDY